MKVGQRLAEVNPDLTQEVMARVDAIVERYKEKPGALSRSWKSARVSWAIFQWSFRSTSAGLKVSASSVYGVVTFYSFFSMVPKGRHTVKVCMGTACYVKGIGEVLNRLQSGVQA